MCVNKQQRVCNDYRVSIEWTSVVRSVYGTISEDWNLLEYGHSKRIATGLKKTIYPCNIHPKTAVKRNASINMPRLQTFMCHALSHTILLHLLLPEVYQIKSHLWWNVSTHFERSRSVRKTEREGEGEKEFLIWNLDVQLIKRMPTASPLCTLNRGNQRRIPKTNMLTETQPPTTTHPHPTTQRQSHEHSDSHTHSHSHPHSHRDSRLSGQMEKQDKYNL